MILKNFQAKQFIILIEETIMKKIRLSLSELKVDSFETIKQPKNIGTIKGNLTATESPQCKSEYDCNTYKTCDATCLDLCDPPPSNNTCDISCNGTCVSCVTCIVFDCKTINLD